MAFARLLVPIDFSDSSRAATEQAVALAKEMHSEVELLHCHPVVTALGTSYGVAVPDTLYQSIRESAQARLAEEKDKIAAEGIVVRAHLTAESPSFAIADIAKQLDVDCIVMGTRGLSGLKHVLLGSVAERTLREAHCPVLTVPVASKD